MIERVGIFADFGVPNNALQRDVWVERLLRLAVTDVYLGANEDEDTRWRWREHRDRYLLAGHAIRQAGMDVHIMPWLHADFVEEGRGKTDYLRDMLMDVLDACDEVGARSLLLDGEWYVLRRDDADDRSKAADLLREVVALLPIEVGLTSYAKLPGALEGIASVVDYGIAQALSIWWRQKWTKGPATEPGPMQKAAWDSWTQHCNRVVLELPAYGLKRPSRNGLPPLTAEASFLRAITTAHNVGCEEVAYWSLKWTHKPLGKPLVGDWIAGIRGRPSA